MTSLNLVSCNICQALLYGMGVPKRLRIPLIARTRHIATAKVGRCRLTL